MEDFIAAAIVQSEEGLFAVHRDRFTHVILNPPYKKIMENRQRANCSTRQGLRYRIFMLRLYGCRLSCWSLEANWWRLRPEVFVMGRTSAGLELIC